MLDWRIHKLKKTTNIAVVRFSDRENHKTTSKTDWIENKLTFITCSLHLPLTCHRNSTSNAYGSLNPSFLMLFYFKIQLKLIVLDRNDSMGPKPRTAIKQASRRRGVVGRQKRIACSEFDWKMDSFSCTNLDNLMIQTRK